MSAICNDSAIQAMRDDLVKLAAPLDDDRPNSVLAAIYSLCLAADGLASACPKEYKESAEYDLRSGVRAFDQVRELLAEIARLRSIGLRLKELEKLEESCHAAPYL